MKKKRKKKHYLGARDIHVSRAPSSSLLPLLLLLRRSVGLYVSSVAAAAAPRGVGGGRFGGGYTSHGGDEGHRLGRTRSLVF